MYCLGKESFNGVACYSWLDDLSLLVLSGSGSTLAFRITTDAFITSRFETGLKASCIASTQTKHQNQYKCIIGSSCGKISLYMLSFENNSFFFDAKSTISKPLRKGITCLKWVPKSRLFVSLSGETQLNVHKSNCSVIRNIDTFGIPTFHFVVFDNDVLFFPNECYISQVNIQAGNNNTRSWHAHDDLIISLQQNEVEFWTLSSFGHCSRWNMEGERIWHCKLTYAATCFNFCFSVNHVYIESERRVECFDLRTKYNSQLSNSHSPNTPLSQRLMEGFCRSNILAFIEDNNDISLWLPVVYTSNHPKFVISTVEPNIIRLQSRIDQDDFNLLDAKSPVLSITVGGEYLFVSTAALQLRVFCLETTSCLGLISNISLASILLMGPNSFLYKDSIYNLSCKLEVRLQHQYISENNVDDKSLNDRLFISFYRQSEKCYFYLLNLGNKKESCKEIFNDVEVIRLGKLGVGAFKDNIGRLGIFSVDPETLTGFTFKFIQNCFVENFVFSGSNVICATHDSQDKLTLLLCPEAHLRMPFLLKHLFYEINLFDKRSYQLLSMHENKVFLKNKTKNISETISLDPGIHKLFDSLEKEDWKSAELICFISGQHLYWGIFCAVASSKHSVHNLRTGLAQLGYLSHGAFIATKGKGVIYEEVSFRLLHNDYFGAEKLILSKGKDMLAQAVRLNVKIFNFERAKELSKGNQDLFDYVSLYENRYLAPKISKDVHLDIKQAKKKLFPLEVHRENVFPESKTKSVEEKQ